MVRSLLGLSAEGGVGRFLARELWVMPRDADSQKDDQRDDRNGAP